MERFAIKFDEKIPLNLCKICRLCGTNNSADTLILEDKTFFGDGDVELWKKIQACVGIKVYKSDKLPKNICNLCHDKILDFFEFREMCLSIDSQTRRILGLPTLETKKKERKRKSEFDAISPIDSKLAKLNNDELLVPNKIVKPRNQGRDTNKKKKTSTKDNKEIKLEQNYEFHSLEAKNFQKQTLNETTNGKKNRICSICGGTFNSIKFEEHLASVHVPRIFQYHCVRCDETMVNKVDIKNHNLWHKLSKTPYVCGRCNRHIDSLAAYTRHLNDCLVFDQSLVYPNPKCHVCDKEFETQNLYDMHQCVILTLKCPKCNKTFSNSGNTLKHIIRCNVKTSLIRSIKGQQQLQINKTSTNIGTTTAFTESNAFVMIPASSGVTLNSSELSSSSSSPTLNSMKNANEKNKKCKKLTKKDMQRFDDLLKSTYETLQNIKQEPKDNIAVPVTATTTTADVNSNSDVPVASGANDNNDEQDINDVPILEKETEEHIEETDHHADDNYSSDDEIQTAVNVKQEVIDIHYTDIEKSVSGSTGTHTEPEKTAETQKEKEQQEQQQQQQPTIKLKIKLEHGTLNSSLIDVNNSENSTQDIVITKKKKKKKNNDKSIIDKFPVCNIKQEPMGHEEEEEEDDLQNSDQTDTQDNDVENNENENIENHDTINNSTESSLPIICSVSSLANQINDNSQSQNSTLPVISSVYSGVHIESSSNTDSISQNLSANIAIKQEIMEEYNDNNLTTNLNETMTNENEVHETEDNNLTTSLTSFPNTENISSDMEILRIKKEIDYEEYTNQEQNIGNYSQSLNTEIQQNNTLSSFMDDITVKEEIHISYDNQNIMDCDYGNNDDELNNVSEVINSDKNTEMEVCQSENENENENSSLMKISETENGNTENDKLENNLSSNIPDSSFSFKRIVLKNFENNEVEKPISDIENCSKNILEDKSIPPTDSDNTLEKILTPTDSNITLDKKDLNNESAMSGSAVNEVVDTQNQANEESKVIEGPSYFYKNTDDDDVNICKEDVNNCAEKDESIQNVESQIESENSMDVEINTEMEKNEIKENYSNEMISKNPKSPISLKSQNIDNNIVQEKFNNDDESITTQTSHDENSEIIKNLNDVENEKGCEINHEDITDDTETLYENKNDEQEESHKKDMEEVQTTETVLSENDNDEDDKADDDDLNEDAAGLLDEHMTEKEQDNKISENDENDELELESELPITATMNEQNNQKELEKLNEIPPTVIETQDEEVKEDLKIVEKKIEHTEMSDSLNVTEFCENPKKPPVDNSSDVIMEEDNDAQKSDNKIITLESNIKNNCDQQNEKILNTENIEKIFNDCSTENSSKSDNLIEKFHDSNTVNENSSDKIHDN